MKVTIWPRFLQLLALLPLLFVMQGCPYDPEAEEEAAKIVADPDYAAKSFLRTQYMDVYYYWRDDVKDRNAAFKPYDYDIYDFFDKMLYAKDRWSWMCDKEAYVSDETGVIAGTWGISLAQAVEYFNDYGLHVRYIYPGSPLEPFGVTRGAVLTHINGQNVADDEGGFSAEKVQIFQDNYSKSPQTFTFRLADGRDTTFTASMASSLNTRSSLITRIFQPGEFPGLTEPVGYFLYLSFKANFLSDIHDAMVRFHDAGVRKLIVDLRYNGGGDARASQLLIDYLAPKAAEGKPYVVRKHNSYLASVSETFSDANNTGKIIPPQKEDYQQDYEDRDELKAMYEYWKKVYPNRLELDGLYFITGHGSASASEMVINGLRPYMGDKLQMVGDTTYGKPNGMYVLMYPGSDEDYEAYYERNDFSKLQWVFLPICFFNQNSLGESIPWENGYGFVPDNYRPDDVYHDFGLEEDLIQACLSRIVSGTYPAVTAQPRRYTKTKGAGYKGAPLEREEDEPGYGRYMMERPPFLQKK